MIFDPIAWVRRRFSRRNPPPKVIGLLLGECYACKEIVMIPVLLGVQTFRCPGCGYSGFVSAKLREQPRIIQEAEKIVEDLR